MTWVMVLSTLSVVAGTVSWVVVALRRLSITDARTEQALTDCPPAARAAVLKAAGEYADALRDQTSVLGIRRG